MTGTTTTDTPAQPAPQVPYVVPADALDALLADALTPTVPDDAAAAVDAWNRYSAALGDSPAPPTEYAADRLREAAQDYRLAAAEYARGTEHADGDDVLRARHRVELEQIRHGLHRSHRNAAALHALARTVRDHLPDADHLDHTDPRRYSAPLPRAWRTLARAIATALAFLVAFVAPPRLPAAPTNGPARPRTTPADTRLPDQLTRALTAAPAAPPHPAVAARA